MANDQASRVDSVLQDLRTRIPSLVKDALLHDEVTRIVTSPRVRDTLEDDANRNAESILQTSNIEIIEVRKAHEALAAHEGRALGGPDPNSVSLALKQTVISLLIAITFVLSAADLGQRGSASQDWFIFVVAGIVTFNLAWGMISRVVAVARPGAYTTSEIYWAGARFLASLFPTVLAVAYITLNNHWVFRNPVSGFVVTGTVGLVVLAIQVAIALWIPRTKYFYAGSRDRRQILKQVGASAFWFSTMSVLYETIPAIASSFIYLLRYQSAARHTRRGSKPLTGGNSIYHWYRERQRLESDLEGVIQAWADAIIRKGILPFLRYRINEITTPPFSLELKIYDSPGLSQMSAQEYVVATSAFARQSKAVDRLEGGIVGIAGPRGAGKTTVLQAYKAGRFLKAGEQQIVVFESVPVAYDARDFILHLYFQVCVSVANFIDEHGLGGVASKLDSERTRRNRLGTLLSILAIIWTPVFWFAITTDRNPHFKLPLWFTRSEWLIGLAVALSGTLVVYRWERRRDRPSELYNQEATDLRSLRELARRKMMDIKFQQSHTFGWGGKLGMPAPYVAEFSKSHDLEFASKSRTYPEIVGEFQYFLTTTIMIIKSMPNLAKVPLVIILDELDKISSIDNVREFINEAKGFLRTQDPGVLCLISVSEDALTSFEERGLPARDALDSAFDTIVDVGYLSMADSIQLLNRRLVGMSLPFICLCHCLAGGLPRELVRTAREVAEASGSTLSKVCNEVVINDLHGKLGSWRSAVAGSKVESQQKAELIGYVNENTRGAVTAASLLRTIANHPALKTNTDMQIGAAEALLQITTYFYFAATVLEIFSDALTEADVKEASIPGTPGSFDGLASVRQQFSVSSRIAWANLNVFRATWNLTVIDYPELVGA